MSQPPPLRALEYARRDTGPLVLDLHRPHASAPVPVVVWLHGGGWFTGDRELAPDPRHLTERGIAMASIEYRLSGDALFPAQLHDVRAAIRWFRAHAGELGLDGDRIALWGASAGGHLAALAGLTGHFDALPGEQRADHPRTVQADADHPVRDASVTAVAAAYPPVDLLGDQVPPGAPLGPPDPAATPEARLLGGIPAEHPDRARSASPLTYVTADAPPFQIAHGTGDLMVPSRHSELLYEALLAAGADAELWLVDGYRHGFLNPAGRADVPAAMDDGRLAAEVSPKATVCSSRHPCPVPTTFGFDRTADFLARCLTEGSA
ncbi:acetyl esterase/lipase [Mumia flava]|uniref:Acetyl esterase/lipase n=1 Tax=Mumia flava TaxID=1348852 RepID=A0A2M9ARA9_9ACTN